MQTRFQKNAKVFDIFITAIAGMVSVAVMLYAIVHFGLRESWPELVLNLFYIACIVMIWLYVFNRIDSHHFNYWSSVCIGVTALLRDILFPPPLSVYAIHLLCLVLSTLLLCMLTFFYARKNWQSYTKHNLWLICIVDLLIATLYNYAIYLEPINEYSSYLLTEIWIRPTISYGLVACFVTQSKKIKKQNK